MVIWTKPDSLSRIVETVRLLNKSKAVQVLWSYRLHVIVPLRRPGGSYQPQIVPKRQVVLTPQLEQKVLSLYSVGNSYAYISQHLLEMYGYSLSDSELTVITDKVIPAMRKWQNRPLESLYTLVWLDGIYRAGGPATPQQFSLCARQVIERTGQ